MSARRSWVKVLISIHMSTVYVCLCTIQVARFPVPCSLCFLNHWLNKALNRGQKINCQILPFSLSTYFLPRLVITAERSEVVTMLTHVTFTKSHNSNLKRQNDVKIYVAIVHNHRLKMCWIVFGNDPTIPTDHRIF